MIEMPRQQPVLVSVCVYLDRPQAYDIPFIGMS